MATGVVDIAQAAPLDVLSGDVAFELIKWICTRNRIFGGLSGGFYCLFQTNVNRRDLVR